MVCLEKKQYFTNWSGKFMAFLLDEKISFNWKYAIWEKHLKLVKQKWTYPYEYMNNSSEGFDETKLPDKKDF